VIHQSSFVAADRTIALFSTAYISVTDTSYLWIMAWIAQDPSAQGQIKDFQLTTSEWREVRRKSSNALHTNGGSTVRAATVGEQNATWRAKDIVGQIIPTYRAISVSNTIPALIAADQSIRIEHNGKYLWITRKMINFARTQSRTVDHLQIV
jgi:chaperone BCS1